MPDIKVNYPGVFVQELAAGVHAIQGVPTSVTAFVGPTPLGPLNQPVQVMSFQDFTRTFGELAADVETGYAVCQYFLNGGEESWVVRVPANPGRQQYQDGCAALDKGVDLFNLLVLPGVIDPTILADAEAFCEQRRAFLLVDSPVTGAVASDPAGAMAQAVQNPALPKSKNAAVYFPWLNIADPVNHGQARLAPPTGTIAGLYARTDSSRGVWHAPAGTEAMLVGVQGLACVLTDQQNGVLNPLAVNCLRKFPFGNVCWGARTLWGADALASEWKYVPVRRMALFLEESLYRGTKWTVFEPNDEALWAQIRLNVGAFMQGLFRQGAFQGRTPKDAYFVKCDRDTTTQNDINQGVVNLEVGFAPLKPAEFVVIQVQQAAGQIQT